MRSLTRRAWGVAAVIAVLLFLLHLVAANDDVLYDDAADYMLAAQAPFHATWLNTNSSSPLELLRLRRANPEFAKHPWESLYIAGDNAALRHFHSPLSFYAMHAVYAFGGNAHAQRLLTDAVASIACGVLCIVLAGFGLPLPFAALLTLYAGLQSRFVEVSANPTPHAWYLLLAALFLFCFTRYLVSHESRYFYGAAISLGFAFATLEFTVELLATVPAVLWLGGVTQKGSLPARQAFLKLRLPALVLFFATTFVVWPGGWLRGGYLENYGLLTAQMLLRHKSAFAAKPLSLESIYRALFSYDVVVALVFVCWIAACAVLLTQRRLSIASIVFSTYAVLALFLGIADQFRLSPYVSEFVFFLLAAAGCVGLDLWRALDGNTRRLRRPLAFAPSAIALLLVIGCVTAWRERWDAWGFRSYLDPVFSGISAHVPAGSKLLVTQDREALTLYLPHYSFEPTMGAGSGVPWSPERNTDTRFFLFDSALGAPAGAHALGTYPVSEGHTLTLWQR